MLRLVFAAILFASLSLSACNAPLSLGYQIEKKEIEVRFVSSPAQTLHLRATYHLKNIGSAPLDSLEAILPAESNLDRRNLTIQVDGHPVTSQPTGEDVRSARIPFDPPWPVKSRRSLVIEYDLAPPDQLTKDAFYLHPNNWYPALLPPKHLLSRADPPDKWDLRVRVPDGFLVHASGKLRGSSRSGTERVFRFTQRPNDDFRPFIVSGRYHQQQFRSNGIIVNFWSFQPVPDDKIRRAGTRITSIVITYETLFGPRSKKNRPVWIAQCPIEGIDVHERRGDMLVLTTGSCPALPETSMFLIPGDVPKEQEEGFFYLTAYMLAYTWFGYYTSPSSTQWLPMDAAANYAAEIVERLRGGESVRAKYAAGLLKQFDRSSSLGPARPLTAIREIDPPEDRASGYAKSEMFFLALEDQCGRDKLVRALAHIVRARRDLDWSIDDLRSALELESGQNLAEFFRIWLYQPGIPDDFRRRYSQAP